MGFGLKADVSSGRRLAVLGVLRMEWRPGEGEAGRQLGERTPGVEVLRRFQGGWAWTDLGVLLEKGEQWVCARARDS